MQSKLPLSGHFMVIKSHEWDMFLPLGKVITLLREAGWSIEQRKMFMSESLGQAWREVGGQWTLNDVMQHIVDKTGITFVSDSPLTIDANLYKLVSSSELNDYI